MDHGFQVLRTHPQPPPSALADCLWACLDCALACSACADACLAEKDCASLVACIRLDGECAAVCVATAHLLIRSGSPHDRAALHAQLAACAAICSACEAECRGHAAHHRHCAHCAEACRACREACEAAMKAQH